MPISDDFLNYIVDQLAPWARVSVKKMFGGAGVYREGKMFGLVADDVFYLKVDDSNRADFVEAGAEPFRPYDDHSVVMSYYEAPARVVENRDELAQWAQKAWIAARKKKPAGSKKKTGQRGT